MSSPRRPSVGRSRSGKHYHGNHHLDLSNRRLTRVMVLPVSNPCNSRLGSPCLALCLDTTRKVKSEIGFAKSKWTQISSLSPTKKDRNNTYQQNEIKISKTFGLQNTSHRIWPITGLGRKAQKWVFQLFACLVTIFSYYFDISDLATVQHVASSCHFLLKRFIAVQCSQMFIKFQKRN